MRTFIAVDLSEEIRTEIKELQKQFTNLEIDPRRLKLKFVNPWQAHQTVKFLGEVPEEQLEPIKQALENISFDPFEAILSGIGAFPTSRNPRVVWAGLEPHDKITAIQQQIDSAMTKIGFEKDSRFHPHLTLARIKFCNNRKEFASLLDSIKIEQSRFSIGSFKLIKSTLTPQGPVYEVLASFNNR